LKPTVGIEAPWTEIATVARQLVDRSFKGKAVLHLPDWPSPKSNRHTNRFNVVREDGDMVVANGLQ
jgi:hypothetical protein